MMERENRGRWEWGVMEKVEQSRRKWRSWGKRGGEGKGAHRHLQERSEGVSVWRRDCSLGNSAAKHSRGERLHRASFPRPPSIVTFCYWCRVLGPDLRPTGTMLPVFSARSACLAHLSPNCLPSPVRGGNQSHTRHPTCSTALLGQRGKATGA